MDTGDVVLHKPSGEHWVIAYVEGEQVCCCGWPKTYAPVRDCNLVKIATSEERLELLRKMADMAAPDTRRTYARHRLEQVLPKLY